MKRVHSGKVTVIDTISSRVYRRHDGVVCRHVGSESVLVPIRNNVGNLESIYTLSPVAARVWELLDGVRSVEQIVEILCHEYDVSPAEAAADVAELLGNLSEASLVSGAT